MDEPVYSPATDALGRWQFAERLADMILAAPPRSSFRMGVFGGWGEGKTSVLRMMERKLVAEGNASIWIVPWATNSVEELQRRVLFEMCKRLGVDVAAVKRAKSLSGSLERVRGVGAELDWKLKLINSVAGSAVQSVADSVSHKYEDKLLPALLEKLSVRRMVVFVDDLDRARPEILPDFLLTIREAFDLPNVFYVMALSPDVVQQGLAQLHKGWGEVDTFLEKIIEVPEYLPQIEIDEITHFAETQIHALEGRVRADVLLDLIRYLPRNPRRLKLLLRYLSGIHPVLERFSPNELNFGLVYLCQMLHLEFPKQTAAMALDSATLNSLGMTVGSLAFARGSDKALEPKELPEHKYAEQTTEPSRFLELCDAIRKREMPSEYGIREALTLVARAPLLTRKEFGEILNTFAASDLNGKQVVLMHALGDGVELHRDRVQLLFSFALDTRDRLLGLAADQTTLEDVADALGSVQIATDLLSSLITDVHVIKLGYVRATDWIKLLHHLRRWAAWTAPEYNGVRKVELKLLEESAVGMPRELQLDILSLLDRDRLFQDNRERGEPAQFAAAVSSITETWEIMVCDSLLARFQTPEGVVGLATLPTGSIEREYAFEPDSRFHQRAYRVELAAIARTANANAAIHANFYTYLRLLMEAAFGQFSSFSRSSCRALLSDLDFARVLWIAATSVPLNRRMMGTLVQQRAHIIEALAVPEEMLPLPDWWDDSNKQVRSPGEIRHEESS